MLAATPGLAKDAPEAQKKANTWYASALRTGGAGTVVTHFWSKGPRMRAETVIAGHRIVTLVTEDYYTVIDELRGQGTVIARSANAKAADKTRVRPFAFEREEVTRLGGEFVRKEEIGGRSLDLYRITNNRGRQTVWVDGGETKVPVRVEVFDRKRAATFRTDYLGWMHGMEIPSRFFDPAANIELKRLTYEQFATVSSADSQSPAPVFYSELLHGKRPDE